MRDVRAELESALGGSYTLERELGGGGMSRVFVATDTTLHRSVVIKVIAPDLVEGMSAERFAREVQVAARLQQANIVPVLTAGTANGLPYYTMPFVRGMSLRARLAAGEPVPVAEAVHILRDVARALAYAHGEGVVHRDIKPENVLLSGGAAVVTDLGIAKAIDISRTRDGNADGSANVTLTQAGSMLGTPAYMAPEQAAGDPSTDHRADIYAWGLIAWELLTGRHPFAARTSVHAIVAAQLSEMPAPLVSVRNDVPAALSDLVQRCLAKDPDHRPASARELLAALDQAVSTGSGTAAASAPASLSATALRRKARLRVVIAAPVIALVALGVWFAASRASRTTAATGDKSLAVIPFASLSGDTANAYLAEGIAGEVTNTLSDVPGLRLAGRSSAARFAGGRVSAQDAGRTLGVALVLDGTLQRARDQIRVSVELTNVSDGHVTWHDDYVRPASDIIAVQDDISRAIAGQLQVTLANAGSSAAHGTSDAAAYDLYLRGQYLYRRRGAGITAAIAAFEQATVRDSTFARAWAALSNALTVSPSYVATRMGDVLPRARAAAERAVRLDSTLSEAYLALGYANAESFRWPQAEAELRRAIALDPNAAEPRYRLGYTLVNQDRMADAIPVLQQAVARDPLYFMPAVYLGWAEVSAGRVAEGLEEERRGLALEPGSISSLCILALGSANAGLPDSAKFYAHRIVAISSAPARLGVAAHALALAGDEAGARDLLRRIEQTPGTAWTHWTGLALAYAGLHDTAQFVNALEHAASGDGDAFPTYGARIVNAFPADPRIVAVLRRYNLDPARFLGRGGAPRVGRTEDTDTGQVPSTQVHPRRRLMTMEREARIAPLPAGIVLASITAVCCFVVPAQAQTARAITPSCETAFGGTLCVTGKMMGEHLVELDAIIPMAVIANAPAKAAMVWPPAEAAVVRMPADVRTATGIDHLTFYWEPMGHPPKPFETPHFDFHFYTISDSARRAIDCVDKSKPAALPAGYSLEDITVPGVGLLVGTCVPRMGMHAGNYSRGPVPFHAMMVLGSYHGQPIFFEPMIAQKTLMSRQPLALKVATPAGTSATVRYPARFAARYNAATDAYTFAFTGFKP